MTGFNMPPGVSVSDIPGNRPEDLAEEAFWEHLYARFTLSPNEAECERLEAVLDNDDVQRAVLLARDMGYELGYADARVEAELAEAYAQDAG